MTEESVFSAQDIADEFALGLLKDDARLEDYLLYVPNEQMKDLNTDGNKAILTIAGMIKVRPTKSPVWELINVRRTSLKENFETCQVH
jgi:hypothetical protein